MVTLSACGGSDNDGGETTSPIQTATKAATSTPTPTYTSDVLVPPETPTSSAAPAGQRSTTDRPDDKSGPQIHLVYVLPSDGIDRELDINGTIATSWAAGEKWLGARTGGRTLRLDTYDGEPDISFFQVSRTDADIMTSGAYVRNAIELGLRRAGFEAPDKVYAAYYDGGSTYACGGGAWPPTLEGTVAAMYLLAAPIGYIEPCSANTLAADVDSAGYLEHSMIHEIIHTLGHAARCSPNHTLEGHVSDSYQDLMYSGSESWFPEIVDIGNDDYYGHSNPDCPDLEDSLYLTP